MDRRQEENERLLALEREAKRRRDNERALANLKALIVESNRPDGFDWLRKRS